MSLYSDIPTRFNSTLTPILASWFNLLKDAGVSFFGTESKGQTNFSILASQTNTDVTGLVLDKLVTESATIKYTMKTATKFEKGAFELIFNGTVWSKHDGSLSGDDSGITFDVNTSTGQVDYTSGLETGTLKYKIETFDI